jgi:glycosyltransferase involved in cell wall biosynthesis
MNWNPLTGFPEIVSLLFTISVLGLLGVTILFPLIAWPTYRLGDRHRRLHPAMPPFGHLRTMDIFLPAHNEAALIGSTLASLLAARDYLARHAANGSPTIHIHVGADNCEDDTGAIARAAGAQVTEFSGHANKWLTLKSLCESSDADWVFLVDAGTLWPEDFLFKAVSAIEQNPDLLAISPSYRPLHAGLLHRMIWVLEIALKRLEVFCGGPVSVHGATVGYQGEALRDILARLGDTRWLNDDVVIPLMMRSVFPEGRILYPAGYVQDAGVSKKTPTYARRKRMLLGNLQWARIILPYSFRRNPVAGLIAMRRLFRVLWAYWLGLSVVGLAIACNAVLPTVALAVGAIVFSHNVRDIAAAAWESLLAPVRLAQSSRPLQEVWK